MDQETWPDLAIFAAIAELGSFTKAAVRFGVSASALSHRVRAMEARLGVRLLNRTTRSVAPTAAGEQLLARLRPAIGEIAAALEGLNEQRDRPAGRVRINAHRGAALHAVLPRLAAFADAYPDITVELVIDDGLVDIVAERFDAGVRHRHVLEQDMVSVRVSDPVQLCVVGSPGYLARFGVPGMPGDLLRHRCLNYRYQTSGAVHDWQFVSGGQVLAFVAPGPFVTNDADALMEGALVGLGLACVTEPQAARHVASGALVRVLQEWCPAIPANYLYYPSRQQMSAAFTAFVGAMREGVAADPPSSRPGSRGQGPGMTL